MIAHLTRRAALALCAMAAIPVALALAQTPGGVEPLSIVSAGGRHAFEVEVMRDDAQRSQGLMFRRAMAPSHGMLFDFDRVEPVAMWMKNTYLPLDMLFIRADGVIARIAADAEPLSLRIIPSNEPVLAVLELNAGTAARLGVKAGDRVEHAMFKRR